MVKIQNKKKKSNKINKNDILNYLKVTIENIKKCDSDVLKHQTYLTARHNIINMFKYSIEYITNLEDFKEDKCITFLENQMNYFK